MSKPETLRTRLMRFIHYRVGCRLDDAAGAADAAMVFFRSVERTGQFERARAEGLSYGQIGRIFQIDKTTVFYALNPRDSTSTDEGDKLPSAA